MPIYKIPSQIYKMTITVSAYKNFQISWSITESKHARYSIACSRQRTEQCFSDYTNLKQSVTYVLEFGVSWQMQIQ